VYLNLSIRTFQMLSFLFYVTRFISMIIYCCCKSCGWKIKTYWSSFTYD